jgi:peptidoglycan/xylan/chitin deacetylase (PgdA/CDA1 family)
MISLGMIKLSTTFVIAALMVSATRAGAQNAFQWPSGKRAAVVLTYDDALESQLDVAIPQLDSAGFKGTFFLKADFTDAQMDRWRGAAKSGHELGNHSLYHPCAATFFPAEPEYTAERYRVRTMIREIGVMNRLLHAIDGRPSHNYAYPCSVSRVADGDYSDSLRTAGLVSYARTGGYDDSSVVTTPARLDRYRVPSFSFARDPGLPAFIALIERARATGGLFVVQFHGVGGDYQFASAQTHRELLRYLKSVPDVWVGTFQEVMDCAVATPAAR